MSTDTQAHTEEPTPETDALIVAKSGFGPTDFEWRTHARRLERQRIAARAELSRVYQWIESNHPDGFIDSQTHWQNLQRVADYHAARLDQKAAKIKDIQAEHTQMCTRLRECVQKHDIGLGGEKLDQLVCDHIDAQAAEITTMRAAITQAHEALTQVLLSFDSEHPQWITRDVPAEAIAKLQPFLHQA